MRWSRFLVLGAIGVLVYLLAPHGLARIGVYALVTVMCLAVFAFAGRYRRSPNRSTTAFLTVGLIAWGAGDVITGLYLLGARIVPMVSPADAAYVVGHLAFIAGVVVLKDDLGRRVYRMEDILEALIVATGLALAAWVFVVGTRAGTVLDADTFGEFWPVIVYTCADGFVLSLMVILMLSKRARTVPFVMTAAAFLSFAVSGWALYTLEDGLDFRDTTFVCAGWLVGYVLLASAATYPPHRLWMMQEGGSKPKSVVESARLTGLSAAILMSPVVMGIELVRGVPVAEWGWVVLCSSILVVALVAARMACFLVVLGRQSDALSIAATTDTVTGLANRRRLGELLDGAILAEAVRGVVVFVVDIDRFAQINETFGYSVGDRVLREIGERLTCAAGTGAIVGRLGGDQFVVTMAADKMLSNSTEGAERLRNAVSRTMFVRDINVALDAAVGFAESTKNSGADAETLLQHAHVALTAAKRGHTRTSVYSPAMDVDRHDQMRLLGELETALRERQLRVFFQPCLDLESGTVSGVEALLRWQHPRDGLISPWSFLPDAERTGLLPAITAYVLEDSLDCCSVIRRTRPNFGISVNLSVRNLLDPGLVEQVARALQRHRVPASAVEFEVTETTAMTDPRRSVDSLVALRDIGVSIAIDDYGTGYSSLAYLRSLPVQTLKIDKSFVTAMNSQPTNASIVGSTIDLARSLGMTVIAEGVEDAKTLDRLRALGCDGAQGFHIGRPVPSDELEALVERIENRMRSTACTSPVTTGKVTAGAAAKQN